MATSKKATSQQTPTEALAHARARLERAKQRAHDAAHSQPRGAAFYEQWARDDSRARADVADATAAVMRAEHAARVNDAEAIALRAYLRKEVSAAREVYALALPSAPTLTGFDAASVAAHVDAVTAYLVVRAEHNDRSERACVRLHAVLAAVYAARNLLVAARQADGGVTPAPIVPAAPVGSRNGLPYDVPRSDDECDDFLNALDAELPEPQLARLEYEAEKLREQADEIAATIDAEAAE